MPPGVNLWCHNKQKCFLSGSTRHAKSIEKATLFKTLVILTFNQIDDFDMTVASVHRVYYKEICINHV